MDPLSPETEGKLVLLYPRFGAILRLVIQEANKAGYPVDLFEGMRTFERQAELYSKGRDAQGNVIDPKAVVTKAPPGMSLHAYGIAGDLVFRPGGKWSWDGPMSQWEAVGRISRSRGLDPGVFWTKFPDAPHHQRSFGFQTSTLLMLYKQGGQALVWSEIDKVYE